MKLTWSQKEALRLAQQYRDGAIFSRRNVGAREATMRALMYAGCIAWVDDIDDGETVIPYYCITNVGKEAQL